MNTEQRNLLLELWDAFENCAPKEAVRLAEAVRDYPGKGIPGVSDFSITAFLDVISNLSLAFLEQSRDAKARGLALDMADRLLLEHDWLDDDCRALYKLWRALIYVGQPELPSDYGLFRGEALDTLARVHCKQRESSSDRS